MNKNWRVKCGGRHPAAVLFLTIVAMLFSAMHVRAADANLFLQGYDTEEDRVIVYGASLADVGGDYDAEQFTAMISDRECPVLHVSTTAEEEEGITFYCLVDVSGSMRKEQMTQAKEVLSGICEGLGENDNMVIGALGTTLTATDFLTDKEEISGIIDGLTADSEYTAIYDAVIDSISALQSSQSCNRKKCLILISDGDDETVIGKTRSEVLSAIQSSRIPVYTVAALRQSYTKEQIASAENLGVFARQSVGGRDYAPVVDGLSTEEVSRSILEDNRNGLVLTLDTSGVEATKDEVLLNIVLETDGAAYRDTMYLYASDLKFSPKTEDPKQEEPDPKEPDEPDEPDEPVGLPVYWVIIAIVIVLVILLVLFLQIRKKKAQKEAQAEQEKKEQEDAESGPEETDAQGQTDIEARQEVKEPGQDMTVFRPDTAVYVPQYEVKFVAIGHEETVFVLRIPENKMLTIGRNSKADLVLNPEDRRLSSIHCRVRCMQNAMNVWDMNSQNGTFVNGVPIRQIGMATVQNGDSIRMGSYEYRVYINK